MANNPYVNKVVYGNQTIFDVSTDTVIPSVLARNVTALSADGSLIVGTLDSNTQIENVDFISYPNKILYQKNEQLNLSGLQIIAYSPDGFSKDITSICTYNPANGSVLSETGVNTIIVSYGTYIWSFDIYVSDGQYQVPTWAEGTDEEISVALMLHYVNEIDLHNYWNVGDTRTIHISAIDAKSTLTDAMAEQDVDFIIFDKGGKELVTPINGHAECAFIIGNESPLNGQGAINTTRTAVGGWEGCMIREWCNDDFYNAISANCKSWFKLHKNETAGGSGASPAVTSQDYIAYIAEKEYFGVNSKAYAPAEANLKQFARFVNTKNITAVYERSPRNGQWWCSINAKGNADAAAYIERKGNIALFGVI